jgi:carbonic anhydrase
LTRSLKLLRPEPFVQGAMSPSRGALVLVGLVAALAGCEKVQGLISPAKPAASEEAPGEHHKAAEGPSAGAKESKEIEKASGDEEYALPFAWENSATEPLGRTRSFLKDMLLTNGDYMSAGAKMFPTFADKQTPRSTVLTCADSRVQTTAFDASPENDDFLVRNIGNQVENSAGSIEYGVEHLNTPLLLILGHTGCGAVKASMQGIGKLSPAVQAELKGLHAPKKDPKDPKKGESDAWTWAVIANVHDQVSAALARFGKRVHSGRLTVVGAVLDLRNDMGLGAGRIVIVDVNGNQDQQRIGAFIAAVTGKSAPEMPSAKEEPGDAKRANSTRQLLHALSALPPAKGRAPAEHAAAHDEAAPEHEHAPAKTAARSNED